MDDALAALRGKLSPFFILVELMTISGEDLEKFGKDEYSKLLHEEAIKCKFLKPEIIELLKDLEKHQQRSTTQRSTKKKMTKSYYTEKTTELFGQITKIVAMSRVRNRRMKDNVVVTIK